INIQTQTFASLDVYLYTFFCNNPFRNKVNTFMHDCSRSFFHQSFFIVATKLLSLRRLKGDRIGGRAEIILSLTIWGDRLRAKAKVISSLTIRRIRLRARAKVISSLTISGNRIRARAKAISSLTIRE